MVIVGKTQGMRRYVHLLPTVKQEGIFVINILNCDFCYKELPSCDGSAFCDGSAYVINFSKSICCEDCLNDNVDDDWLNVQ